MSKPFDYSKWDNIEISDDEDDCHPNIEKVRNELHIFYVFHHSRRIPNAIITEWDFYTANVGKLVSTEASQSCGEGGTGGKG